MNIVTGPEPPPTVAFGDLQTGDLFIWDGRQCIKSTPGGAVFGVFLNDGSALAFSLFTQVYRLTSGQSVTITVGVR